MNTDFIKFIDVKHVRKYSKVILPLLLGYCLFNPDMLLAAEQKTSPTKLQSGDKKLKLGIIHERNKNFKQALAYYKQAADKGNEQAGGRIKSLREKITAIIESSMILAQRYETSQFPHKDLEKSLLYYGRAYAQGHLQARKKIIVVQKKIRNLMHSLVEKARLLEKNSSNPEDFKKALKLYNEAIRNGLPSVQFRLDRLLAKKTIQYEGPSSSQSTTAVQKPIANDKTRQVANKGSAAKNLSYSDVVKTMTKIVPVPRRVSKRTSSAHDQNKSAQTRLGLSGLGKSAAARLNKPAAEKSSERQATPKYHSDPCHGAAARLTPACL